MKTKLINHFNTFALMASVLVMLLSFPVDSYANSTTEKNNLATITGTVTDAGNGEALIGVTVQVKGTSTATMTDAEGKYQIEAQPSDFLVFTYTGMETQEIGVNTQGVINIRLPENAELVDEVVVIGYGKQKKSLLTGSIS